MLSKEDNELLTRIGPGTAMGALLRQYWIPVLISSELPDRGGAPLRGSGWCKCKGSEVQKGWKGRGVGRVG